jgi:serine/threonine protein kinase
VLTPLTDDDPVAVGPYRLANRIGAGGMGTVYLAFTERHQPVAVKVASAELSEDAEFRRRFQREVRAAQRVRGGAVAAVLDADTSSERPWMVTEYVEGISLADAVRQRGPLAERVVHSLAAGLADALVAIHEAGVVHRDLKPSNVLLAWDGPKVIDFGIAQLDGNATLTRSGHVVGTLAWMAPEQMRGEPAGPAADIFSWGCCVAYAATGRHPFHADRAEVLALRIQRDPPDLGHLPDYLYEAVRTALDKEPRHRPAAARLLAGLSVRPVAARGAGRRATETVERAAPVSRAPSSSPGPAVPAHAVPGSRPAAPGRPPTAGSHRPVRLTAASAQRSAGAPANRTPTQDADRRAATASSLGTPPPVESFRPAQPASAGSAGRPLARPRPALPQPAAGLKPLPAAGSVQALPGPHLAPVPGASWPGLVDRPAQPVRGAEWNVPAALSLVFAVLWLCGAGSAVAVCLGYRGRLAARSGRRPGDALAKVGIVLGWVGVIAGLAVLVGVLAG